MSTQIAEDLRADEPDREQPEEEAVGEPAGNQPAAVVQLALEGLETRLGSGDPLLGSDAKAVRALRERRDPLSMRWPLVCDGLEILRRAEAGIRQRAW